MNDPHPHLDAGDQAALRFLNDWEDGTPKSFGNDFTAQWNGERSCMLTEIQLEIWKKSRNQE